MYVCMYVCVCMYACKCFVCIYCILYVCVCVSIVSFMYVCFVFALVRKNGIVRAPEVKPLINQSINSRSVVVVESADGNFSSHNVMKMYQFFDNHQPGDKNLESS